MKEFEHTKMIVISGKARAGKDTAAHLIKCHFDEHCYKTVICHYADLLKHICHNFFGWNGQKDNEGRSLLQSIGTDVVRRKDPDFWVRFIVEIVQLFDGCWDYVIVPDCRFPNEITFPRDKWIDVVHLHINRDNYDDGLTIAQQEHISETALDGVVPDYTINNNGSLKDLDLQVKMFMEAYLYGVL